MQEVERVVIAGMQIVESLLMVEPYIDWSQCRSRPRAERRLRQGHPQRVRHLQRPRKDCVRMGDKIVMHPETAKECVRILDDFHQNWQKPSFATKSVPAPVSDPNTERS